MSLVWDYLSVLPFSLDTSSSGTLFIFKASLKKTGCEFYHCCLSDCCPAASLLRAGLCYRWAHLGKSGVVSKLHFLMMALSDSMVYRKSLIDVKLFYEH